MFTNLRDLRQRRKDEGASMFEYAAVIAVAGLIIIAVLNADFTDKPKAWIMKQVNDIEAAYNGDESD